MDGVQEISEGKQMLKNLKELDNLISRLRLQVDAENGALMNTAIQYKNMNVKTSGAKNMLEEKCPEIADLQKELWKYMRELAQKKANALKMIKKLNYKDQQLLILYYLANNTQEKMAEAMDMSYKGAWMALQRAVDNFEIIYQNEKST